MDAFDQHTMNEFSYDDDLGDDGTIKSKHQYCHWNGIKIDSREHFKAKFSISYLPKTTYFQFFRFPSSDGIVPCETLYPPRIIST